VKVPGILSFVIALSLSFQAAAFDGLAELYEGCSVAHVPFEKRTRDDHITLRRCVAFLLEAATAAPMVESIAGPKPTPSNFFDRFDRPPTPRRTMFDDIGRNYLEPTAPPPIACPPSTEFSEGRRVMAFLNYWDRKGVPWRLLAPSPTSAAVEALAATYPECLKAAGQ